MCSVFLCVWNFKSIHTYHTIILPIDLGIAIIDRYGMATTWSSFLQRLENDTQMAMSSSISRFTKLQISCFLPTSGWVHWHRLTCVTMTAYTTPSRSPKHGVKVLLFWTSTTLRILHVQTCIGLVCELATLHEQLVQHGLQQSTRACLMFRLIGAPH
jgi:hypothetical protein